MAIGVGTAVFGTLFLLALAVVLRSRLCSSHHHPSPTSSTLRSNGNSNSHCEKTPHGSSLMSGQPLSTPNPNNSSLGCYRQIPTSKSEADTNPDLIPGANSFSTGNSIKLNLDPLIQFNPMKETIARNYCIKKRLIACMGASLEKVVFLLWRKWRYYVHMYVCTYIHTTYIYCGM